MMSKMRAVAYSRDKELEREHQKLQEQRAAEQAANEAAQAMAEATDHVESMDEASE
jgi:hypothetical protein